MSTQQKLKQLLNGVPEDLYDIFVKSPSDVVELEKAYVRLKRWEETRRKVIQLQKEHGLPLEPNASLARVKMRLLLKKKIEELRKIPGINQGEEGNV